MILAAIPEEEECRGEHELYLVNPDGSGLEPITAHARHRVPPLAGTLKGRSSCTRANNTMKILDLASGDVTTLPGVGDDADWSPEGDLIAFERGDDGGSQIWAVEPDGENEHRLTASSAGVYDGQPSWAPDGSRIAFRRANIVSQESPIYTIASDAVDGTGELASSGPFYAPAWSPDGETIAFSRQNVDGTTDLMTAPAAGGAATVLPVSSAPTGLYDEDMGSWQALTVLQAVDEDAEADGTVSTGADATTEEPLQASVTTPNAGAVGIQRIEPVTMAPAGYALVATEFRIQAPPATVADPLAITFVLDVSILPSGQSHEMLELLRDGDPVADSTDAPSAVPDPCVSQRTLLGNGDVSITALSSHASAWNLAVPDIDPPATTITGGPQGATKSRRPTSPVRLERGPGHLRVQGRLCCLQVVHVPPQDQETLARGTQVPGGGYRPGPEQGRLPGETRLQSGALTLP